MTAALLLMTSLVAANPGGWEVRYAQHGDQKPEWTAAGYNPAWTLTFAPDGGEVTWADDAKGGCRGWILLARRMTLPNPLPAGVRVSLDYRTFCIGPARSGMLDAFVMTARAWDALAAEPGKAGLLDRRALPGWAAFTTVRTQGDDVNDWTPSGPQVVRLPKRAQAGEEVLVGVAWGCYHWEQDEHGGVRIVEVSMVGPEEEEQRFWAALDTDRPELAAVQQALDKGDRAAAGAALAKELRERAGPVPDAALGPASDRTLKRADETLAGTYNLVGCPAYTYPGPIVWNADPSHYEQWAIQLNRHAEWLALGEAYLRTHDEKYARCWAAQVRDWVAAMPVYIGRHWIQGPYNEGGKVTLSLDAGIRMGQTWFQSFDVFRHSPSVDDATLLTWLRSCWQHGEYLMRPENFRHGSNWGTMEANGLFHLGVMLPELRDAATWRQTAIDRMSGEIDYQVYPDGAQVELTPGYHGVSLHNFLGTMHLAQLNDVALPADYVARLERMFDYYLKIALPDLTAPALNDSGSHGVQGYFRDGGALFPRREEFRWALTARKEGRPPDYLSLAMPYAGWVIFRSGWDAGAKYLLFDAGPFGTGHQHEDKLHLILHAYGWTLLEDAGNYAYDDSAWRQYVLSTRAHSTVRVDGQDQACRLDPGELRAKIPDTHGFRAEERFEYARSSHTAGYGPKGDRTVEHWRRVLFVKPDYWLVVDDLSAKDDREHAADTLWTLKAPGAEVDAATRQVLSTAAGPQGARLQILPLRAAMADSVRVAMGEKEPEVIGWLPRGFEQLTEAPTAIHHAGFRGRLLAAYALAPFTGDRPPLARVEGDGPAFTLVFADGRRDRFEVTAEMLRAEVGGARFEAVEGP